MTRAMKQKIWYWLAVGFVIGLIVVIVTLAGCMVPTQYERSVQQERQQRESIAAATTTEVVRETKVNAPQVTVSKDGLNISVPASLEEKMTARTGASEDSDAAMSATMLWSEVRSIPLGVRLILLALGLGMIWLVISRSRAVKAAARMADKKMRDAVHSIERRMARETNPETISALQDELTELQRQRAERDE